MIALNHVSLYGPGSNGTDPLLLDTSALFGRREKVGILAPSGSGKSSLARMLCGIEPPDSGEVLHRGYVGWPLGFAGFLHPDLSAVQNIALIARLINQDVPRMVSFCMHFCEFPAGLERPMRDLSPTERAVLAYGCSMVAPVTQLIADESITVGDEVQRMKCEALLDQHLKTGGLVFISKNATQLQRYCDRFLVLSNCRLVPCDDLSKAQTALMQQQTKIKKPELTHV